MEILHVAPIGFPDCFVAGISKETQPNGDVIAVGAQGMSRAHSIKGQIEEEAIDIGVVERTASQDPRHMGIEAIRNPPLLDRNA